MGSGSSKLQEEKEKKEREEKEARDAELQRKMQVEDQERRDECNRQRMRDLRSSELSQRKTEEERADIQRQAALEQLQATKTENNKREDELRKSQFEANVKAAERADEALRSQKDADKMEIMTRENNDQETLKLIQENKLQAEGNIFANVSALKDQNKRFQDECHSEKKQFGIKVEETTAQNNDEVLKESAQTNHIKLGNQQNKLTHESRIMALKEGNTVTKIHVGQAQEKDRKETNFIAAVNRMIQAGRDLPETVDSLEGHTLKLRYGSDASALESDIGLCEIIVSSINRKISKLQDSCIDLSNYAIADHRMVQEMQKNALGINESVRRIQSHLTQFRVSLSDNPITNSMELYKKVQTESHSLSTKINSMPVVTETNHAVAYLRKQRETLALNLPTVAPKGKVQTSLED